MSDRARYQCCDLRRRNAVAQHPVLNGLDALEVIDRDLPSADPLRQRTLLVYFLKPITAAGFTRDNVRITGGERLRNIVVEWAAVASMPPPQLAAPGETDTAALIAALAEPDKVLVVRVAQAGDYSSYIAQLTRGAFDDAPPAGFDPRLTQIEFTFKAECPSDFDCRVEHTCAPAPDEAPDIDYVARDYASFRRLLLDRLAQKVPGWAERNPADQGIALVELLAYAADHLSYRQDAIATEAYLGTARRRVSLRRHAQLVDYEMHDGCNARTFVHLRLNPTAPPLALPKHGTQFLTSCDRTLVAVAANSAELRAAMSQRPVVFEPLEDGVMLHADHNELRFHTWSDEQCCLPKGATRATLTGAHPNLKANDWLLFEEVLGPRTGVPGDANPAHRQVVQLARVWATEDPLYDPPLAVTEIEWSTTDALDFPLCLSSITDEEHGSRVLVDVSVACGNLVLADHGRTLPVENLGRMPAPRVLQLANAGTHCEPATPREIPARYRPVLKETPVTQAAPPVTNASARQALHSTVKGALPQMVLTGELGDNPDQWLVHRSLLNSGANDFGVVVEVESDGGAALRFGDGRCGRRPAAGTEFNAIYRVGNGTAGNIGAEALAHVVGADVSVITRVRNPLAAIHGTDPESAESVRRRAPEAFRTQERAVTPADYVEVTQRHADVERAASRMRWTGSWHTMFVTVDRTGGAPMNSGMRAAMSKHLDRYRMAGHDVAFEEPVYVSLEILLHVCVKPEYFRADVRRALLNELAAHFHPDRFSFGEPVYLSALLAAAHQVPGVASIEARKFGRQGDDDPQPLEDGRLLLGPREIARLDNDPNFPEHGVLTLELHGGK